MRILVFENDRLRAENLKQFVQGLGHKVETLVTSIDDLVYSISEKKPDLVLVSYKKPREKVFKLTGKIQYLNPVPIILMVPEKSVSLLQKAISSGVSWVIEIPVETSNFENAITIAQFRHQDFLKLQELNEKVEMTVREFLHRVKNDLATIASLMHLQANFCDSRETAESLLENADRVRVVAALYDIIRSSDYRDKLRLDDYIELLVSKLTQGIAADSGITFDIATDYIISDATTALNCGLIINEILSNALKHASHEKDKNLHIRVTAKKSSDPDQLEICVQDNGKGLPSDVDPSTATTFGFQLVSMLINQNKGVIKVDRSEGTRITVNLKAT